MKTDHFQSCGHSFFQIWWYIECSTLTASFVGFEIAQLEFHHFVLLGFKITADGDCRHEIKRHLLLGRKVMTNLDSILKSRVITLPTKVHLVKAMVFPVVMYGYESWTIKKAEN